MAHRVRHRTRNAETPAQRMARWRRGAPGFFAFLRDVQPRIPSARGGYEVYRPSRREAAEIRRALRRGNRTIVFCWPRRHGKTVAVALIILWRFLTKRTQNIAMVANSERQVTDTAFRLVRTIIEQTPYTKDLIEKGAIKSGMDAISYPAADNLIQGFPSNPASLYGKKINVAQISELHASRTDDVYQTLASSTIDVEDGLVLVDSTVGSRSSPLFLLYKLARDGTDPSIYFSHIEYADIDDAISNGPPWINQAGLRSRAAQMLPVLFAQQHLNQWSSGSNALFPPEVIERCKDDYSLDVRLLSDGATYAVGGGLDRAYAFSFHGDATVTTCVLKMLVEDEPHYFVLASDKVWMSQASGIKANFERYRKDFELSRVTIEQPNTQDVAQWCQEAEFEAEVVFPSLERKASAYTALYNAAADGRLHILPSFERLLSEMDTFEYEVSSEGSKGSVPKFRHAKGAKDDHLDALAWAVFSLRTVEIPAYAVEGIHCDAPELAAQHCVLNGGSMIPQCADGCRSFNAVRSLYTKYRARSGAAALKLEDFVPAKVVNVGSHTMRR